MSDAARPDHQNLRHPAKRLTLHCNTRDHAHHHSLVIEVIRRARRAKLAGATVFQGVEGFGTSGLTEHQHLVGGNAPVAVVIVDQADRIEAFLHDMGDSLDHVLVTVHDVEIIET